MFQYSCSTFGRGIEACISIRKRLQGVEGGKNKSSNKSFGASLWGEEPKSPTSFSTHLIGQHFRQILQVLHGPRQGYEGEYVYNDTIRPCLEIVRTRPSPHLLAGQVGGTGLFWSGAPQDASQHTTVGRFWGGLVGFAGRGFGYDSVICGVRGDGPTCVRARKAFTGTRPQLAGVGGLQVVSTYE